MKRVLVVFLALVLLALCTTACGGEPDSSVPPASQPETTTTTSALPPAGCTGMGECPVHYLEYHNVPGGLISYAGMSRFDEWLLAHRSEGFTVVDFVQDMEIDKATFMLCTGITEEVLEGYLPGTALPNTILARDYVEAIYSGDPAKIDAVFLRKP